MSRYHWKEDRMAFQSASDLIRPAEPMIPGIAKDDLELSIDILRQYEPPEGYYGCFSGGKDSCVLRAVTELSGVKATWHYNVTTIDPPELLYFMRKHHPDVEWHRPRKNFFAAAQKRGIPTRVCRWCCEEYKEMRSPKGAPLLLGLRAAESPRRAKTWNHATLHRRTGAMAISPLLHWSDAVLWSFIRERNVPVCELYEQGWDRLGCIGCPMSRTAGRLRDFARWPGYELLWKRLFNQTFDRRSGKFGSAEFTSAEEMWDWWLNDKPLPNDDEEECQLWIDQMSV